MSKKVVVSGNTGLASLMILQMSSIFACVGVFAVIRSAEAYMFEGDDEEETMTSTESTEDDPDKDADPLKVSKAYDKHSVLTIIAGCFLTTAG